VRERCKAARERCQRVPELAEKEAKETSVSHPAFPHLLAVEALRLALSMLAVVRGRVFGLARLTADLDEMVFFFPS
jgi:hypothetical protein